MCHDFAVSGKGVLSPMPTLAQTTIHLGSSSFSGQNVYVLWLVGLGVAALTLFQALRRGAPPPRFPTLTTRQWSTLVGWLIVALIAVLALTRRHR
jgi:hypothetical protein